MSYLVSGSDLYPTLHEAYRSSRPDSTDTFCGPLVASATLDGLDDVSDLLYDTAHGFELVLCR